MAMDPTKGYIANLLHAWMDHLSIDMPHTTRHQAFKVSKISGHFAKDIPSWALMIYNGFFVYESPPMESLYSLPNLPHSKFISLTLVPSLSYVHLVLNAFFSVTMHPHHCQAYFERCLGPYFNLRTHDGTTFLHYRGHVSEEMHVGVENWPIRS